MPAKSKAVVQSVGRTFSQPDELRNILEPVMQAAMLAWQNVLVVSKPGCIAGDAIVTVNRAGNGRSLPISELVARLNGGKVTTRGWDLSIPTYISIAKDGLVRSVKLKNAWCSGTKKTYTLTTASGREIRATSDHRFMREDGSWAELIDLKWGEPICVNIGKSQNGNSKKNVYLEIVTKYHPHQKRKSKLLDGSYSHDVLAHRLAYEANMNGLTFNDYIYILNHVPAQAMQLQYLPEDILVHHIDENIKNNDPANLQAVTLAEHRAIHSATDFKYVLDQVGVEKVERLDYFGEEPTYDIEVDDESHNFIANGFVVHNCGKSEILMAMGKQVFGPDVFNGQDRTFVLPCTPSTLPPDIVGYANPVYSIDPQAEEKGIPYWIVKGTPVDEEILYCVLEEATRIGDLGGDTLVHAMHNISKFHRPLYIANANWLIPTPRNEALRDRFSFTIFYQPSVVDIDALVAKPTISSWRFDLPTFEQIEQVQAWTRDYIQAPFDYRCNSVIIDLLKNVQRVCEGTSFEFNNRRVFQLRSMLYAMGCHAEGSNDFTDIPRIAFDALAYSYPVVDFHESSQWRKIIMSLVDRVETEIAEFKSNAYAVWKGIFAEHADRSGNISASQRDALNRQLAQTWTSYEKSLKTDFPNDKRVAQALGEMYSIYRELVLGKNPLR